MMTEELIVPLIMQDDAQKSVQDLNKIAVLTNCTLMLAWRSATALFVTFWYYMYVCQSSEEAARYLETYKAFESKPPDMLMERVDQDYQSRVSGDSAVFVGLGGES